MKIYTGYLMYEKEGDYPEVGEIYLALDPQNRLGPQTWLVSVMGDGTSEGDTVQLGLFWRAGIATEFLLLLNRRPGILAAHLKRVDEYYKSYQKEHLPNERG